MRDIRADRNFSIVDQEETKKDQEIAIQSALPVFDFDESVTGKAL